VGRRKVRGPPLRRCWALLGLAGPCWALPPYTCQASGLAEIEPSAASSIRGKPRGGGVPESFPEASSLGSECLKVRGAPGQSGGHDDLGFSALNLFLRCSAADNPRSPRNIGRFPSLPPPSPLTVSIRHTVNSDARGTETGKGNTCCPAACVKGGGQGTAPLCQTARAAAPYLRTNSIVCSAARDFTRVEVTLASLGGLARFPLSLGQLRAWHTPPPLQGRAPSCQVGALAGACKYMHCNHPHRPPFPCRHCA